MPNRTAKQVSDAITSKGMTPDENHHHMFRMHVDGVTTLVTRISHGASTIGNDLAKMMSKQCALQVGEFWRLVDCTLDQAGWETLVRQRCQGGRNPFLPNR